MKRYQSRTFWLIVFVIVLATALVERGHLSGMEWQTTVVAGFGMWQLRRYGDNRLQADEGGSNVVLDDR